MDNHWDQFSATTKQHNKTQIYTNSNGAIGEGCRRENDELIDPTAINRYLSTIFTVITTPALLLFVRIVAGLSTGGENSNVAAYVYQIAQRDKGAFFMSLSAISTSDTRVASVFYVILTGSMSENHLQSCGWRIPFCFGIILIFVAIWGQKSMQEKTGMTGVWMDWLLQSILTCTHSLVHGCIYYWNIPKLLIDARTRITLFGVRYNLVAACSGGTASLLEFAGEAIEIGIALLGAWLSVVAFSIGVYVLSFFFVLFCFERLVVSTWASTVVFFVCRCVSFLFAERQT